MFASLIKQWFSLRVKFAALISVLFCKQSKICTAYSDQKNVLQHHVRSFGVGEAKGGLINCPISCCWHRIRPYFLEAKNIYIVHFLIKIFFSCFVNILILKSILPESLVYLKQRRETRMWCFNYWTHPLNCSLPSTKLTSNNKNQKQIGGQHFKI